MHYFKHYVIDEKSLGGWLSERDGRSFGSISGTCQDDTGAKIMPQLSVLVQYDVVEIELPYFGNEREQHHIDADGSINKVQTTAARYSSRRYDLTLPTITLIVVLVVGWLIFWMMYPIPQNGKEKYTELMSNVHTARRVADIRSRPGPGMVSARADQSTDFNADVIYSTILQLILFIRAEGHQWRRLELFVGQESFAGAEELAAYHDGTGLWALLARLPEQHLFNQHTTIVAR